MLQKTLLLVILFTLFACNSNTESPKQAANSHVPSKKKSSSQKSDLNTNIKGEKKEHSLPEASSKESLQKLSTKIPANSENFEKQIEKIASKILAEISFEDFEYTSQLIHQDKGLLLSPSINLKLKRDRNYSKEEFLAFGKNKELHTWGIQDGSGEPMNFTELDYLKKIMLRDDYLRNSTVSINKCLGKGNTLINIKEVFPSSNFVEFYIPPADKGGLNWNSIVFIFENIEGYVFLRGIANSGWTI